MARTKIDQTQYSEVYSTSEQITGDVWIDGKSIYSKTINFGALTNTTQKNVAHGISGISNIIRLSGWTTNGAAWITLPYTNPASTDIGIYGDTTYVSIISGADRTSFTTTYVTVYYTKV